MFNGADPQHHHVKLKGHNIYDTCYYMSFLSFLTGCKTAHADPDLLAVEAESAWSASLWPLSLVMAS